MKSSIMKVAYQSFPNGRSLKALLVKCKPAVFCELCRVRLIRWNGLPMRCLIEWDAGLLCIKCGSSGAATANIYVWRRLLRNWTLRLNKTKTVNRNYISVKHFGIRLNIYSLSWLNLKGGSKRHLLYVYPKLRTINWPLNTKINDFLALHELFL